MRRLTRDPEPGESGFAASVDEHIRKLDNHKNMPRRAVVCPSFRLLVSGFEVLGSCFRLLLAKTKRPGACARPVNLKLIAGVRYVLKIRPIQFLVEIVRPVTA